MAFRHRTPGILSLDCSQLLSRMLPGFLAGRSEHDRETAVQGPAQRDRAQSRHDGARRQIRRLSSPRAAVAKRTRSPVAKLTALVPRELALTRWNQTPVPTAKFRR